MKDKILTSLAKALANWFPKHGTGTAVFMIGLWCAAILTVGLLVGQIINYGSDVSSYEIYFALGQAIMFVILGVVTFIFGKSKNR